MYHPGFETKDGKGETLYLTPTKELDGMVSHVMTSIDKVLDEMQRHHRHTMKTPATHYAMARVLAQRTAAQAKRKRHKGEDQSIDLTQPHGDHHHHENDHQEDDADGRCKIALPKTLSTALTGPQILDVASFHAIYPPK